MWFPQPVRRLAPMRVPAVGAALLALTLLAGCGVNRDFGEVRPSLVRDDIHDWLGYSAPAKREAFPPSAFDMTDDERALRDLAYPLIEPSYDRQRWFSVFAEYGLTGVGQSRGFDRTVYAHHLLTDSYRSPAARYATLLEDIRNDETRMPGFFETATRVIDIDEKRRKSLSYVSSLSESERSNAQARIRENRRVIKMVGLTLSQRCESYRYALERLVIQTPSNEAVTVERELSKLQAMIARYKSGPAPSYTAVSSLGRWD